MNQISYDDFAKLDIRVGKIVHIEPIKGKTRIMQGRIKLSDSEDNTRNVIIGGAQYFTPNEMLGKIVIVIVNLEPKKVAGVESNAMLLAADVNDKPFWLSVQDADSVPLGSSIK